MKYVALMRGFGPGNPNMRGDKLREFFTGLGFTNVQTLLASGNILFESDITDQAKLEMTIEKALPDLLGFSRAAIVRSQPQLQALWNADPYKGTKHSRENYLLVTFFKTKPSPAPTKNYYETGGVNALCSILDVTANKTPDFMAKLDRAYGKDQITSRTWLTIERILKKFDA